jgi:hypothetical protein
MRHSVRFAKRRCPSDHRRPEPARGGPSSSPVSPRREAALSRRRCCATRKSFLIRSSCCSCGSRSSSMLVIVIAISLPASLVDAFGDCLFRSAPEASHHQRRHDGNEGHNDPIRNGRDSDRQRGEAHHNHPGNEKQRFGNLGHETSVATGNSARCSELHGRVLSQNPARNQNRNGLGAQIQGESEGRSLSDKISREGRYSAASCSP